MIQSLEIADKIQGGNQRGEKTDSGLWNRTRKSENRKKKYDYGCTWCIGRTLYCEHMAKEATIAWETRQLGIMDWITNDVDWMTKEVHPSSVRLAWHA